MIDHRNEVEDVKNFRTGLIVATIRNQNRTKASDKFWQPSDFFKFHSRREQPKATPEDIEASQTCVLIAMYVSAKTNQKRKQAHSRKGNGE